MAYPIIGQNIQLEITDGYFAGRYNARVQDMEKTTFHIDIPLKPESKMPTTLPDGTGLMVRYRAVDGALCSFASTVLGKATNQIPLLVLKKPTYNEIHRQQRREFLRVPISATFDLVYMDSQTKQIIMAQAQGHDISGGGLAIRVKNDLPVQANDIIGFTFRLPLERGHHSITAKARVIRISPPADTGYKIISMKYFEIGEADRQRVVQYSFKRQIEMREKGVLD